MQQQKIAKFTNKNEKKTLESLDDFHSLCETSV